MALTPTSSNPLDPPVEEVETSPRGDVSSRPGMLQPKASGGASAVIQSCNKRTSSQVQNYKRRSRNNFDETESLSDIDDAEVVRYLNKKEEICLKKMLWEAMNREQVKVKKQKLVTEMKKNTSNPKAVKTSKESEQQKRSSRINYDALEILNDELEPGPDVEPNVHLVSDSRGNDNSLCRNISPEMHRSEEGNYDDEDDGEFSYHNDALSYGYEDEYNDENFDFED